MATKLIKLYQHMDWVGHSAIIYGDYGTCDSGGYRISPTYWWQTNLSSVGRYERCNTGRFVNRSGSYSATYALPAAWLGPTLNDNVGRIWVWYKS